MPPVIPVFLSNVGGTLFFRARDPNFYSVRHLWKSDGTDPGTVPVRTAVSQNSNPSELTNVNGRLLFVATEPDRWH